MDRRLGEAEAGLAGLTEGLVVALAHGGDTARELAAVRSGPQAAGVTLASIGQALRRFADESYSRQSRARW